MPHSGVTTVCDDILQDFDTEAAEQALRPAFAAINADLHKQQPAACHGDCSATQLPFFLRYSSAWVYAAMATTGVSLLEKRKQWQEAVELLQQLLGELCLTCVQGMQLKCVSYFTIVLDQYNSRPVQPDGLT